MQVFSQIGFARKAVALFCCFSLVGANLFAQIRIPVVVHIVGQNPALLTDADVVAGMADLNAAFAHAGPYAIGPGANTGIVFSLARTDPQGGITNGITRTVSALGDLDMDIDDRQLKNLIVWDQQRYLNIWLIDSLRGEMFTSYACGQWRSEKPDGYASRPADPLIGDGIVITDFTSALARYAGIYLGLKYIFEQACQNNDCSVDGDGICDTPPQAARAVPCVGIQNTCSSDTLSGYAIDQPDLAGNFMSFSTCLLMFTEGQASRMRANIASLRPTLAANAGAVNPPCAEPMLTRFEPDNWLPPAGVPIQFQQLGSGAANFEWRINGLVAGGNAPTLSHAFPGPGVYTVSLRAFNANPACYASYAQRVEVGCGVKALFYPDKRTIASKAPYLVDTIHFINHSVNATVFQWLISNDSGMVEQVVSASRDLSYPYQGNATYKVRLVAINGTCRDTSETFTHTVLDPRVDALLNILGAECFQDNKLRVSFNVCNQGYDTLVAGLPISFYDANPLTGPANKLGASYMTTDSVAGNCCGPTYTLIVDAGKVNIDEIYVLLNSFAAAPPNTFPASGIVERNYANNLSIARGLRFTASIAPPSATLIPGDTLGLVGVTGPQPAVSYQWSPASMLSCPDCPNPMFYAGSADTTIKLIAQSRFGCSDSAFAYMSVPPADDYVVSLDSAECAKGDSIRLQFEVCNLFNRGRLPRNLEVRFYDGSPAGGGKFLGPVFRIPQSVSATCGVFEHRVAGSSTGQVYALVNDSLPGSGAGSLFPEVNVNNNSGSVGYEPFLVFLEPGDTSVALNSSFSLSARSTGGQISSFSWVPSTNLSCTSCLNPQLRTGMNTSVVFTAQNRFGCTGSDSLRVVVFLDGPLRIPNAFTPNGDGKNDLFYVLGGKDIASIEEFSIYNRFGQKIFQQRNVQPNDPSIGWNGELQGKKLPSGAYVYLIRIRFQDGVIRPYQGTVTLIR